MNGKTSLDTNIVIRLFKNDTTVIQKLTDYSTVYLPIPVIAELLFSAKNSTRQEENLKVFNEFIDSCNVLNITKETAEHYSSIRLLLKQKGRPIPENDIWISSVCIENSLPLFTGDSHFENVAGLKIIKC